LVLITKQAHLLSLLIKQPEVPWLAKVVSGCAVAYLFSPIQLIPTFIPLIGQLDDLMVLFLGTKIVRKFTPAEILKECEARAELASSVQVARWERRFTPPCSAMFRAEWWRNLQDIASKMI
jgi:uncharacterized membrane protein YkvA (DUF1232 family)